MLKGLLMATMFVVSYGIVYLIFGKAGMELRAKKGKNNAGLVAGIAFILIFWLMCLFFWIGGIAAGDAVLCIVVTFAVPIIIMLTALKLRKKIKAELSAEANATTVMIAPYDTDVYCVTCNKTVHVKKGEQIPYCCGRLMEIMD